MKKILLILLLIIFFSTLLRVVFLDNLPKGFFRDEAALGYNAYSLLKTGKDEYGVSNPLVFRSFEVFFLPAYVYLSVPIIAIFGLTEFSTRLLSAISGILIVAAAFFIAFELTKNKAASVFSALIVSIAPWGIFYSRGAFEGNLGLAFFSLGFLYWLKFLNRNKLTYVIFAIIFFVLSMYSYQAERFVVPLIGIIFFLLSFKQIIELRKNLIIIFLFILILIIPISMISFNAGGYHRAIGVSIFNSKQNPPGFNSKIDFIPNDLFLLRMRQIIALYASYFSPLNLFVKGDYDMQRSVEKFTVFYTWNFPFLSLGFLWLFKTFNLKNKLLLSWIIIAPVPAALTTDLFHTYRSLLLYLPLSILTGIGISNVFDNLSKFKLLFIFTILLISLSSVSFFLYSYNVYNTYTRSRYWEFGYKEIVSFTGTLPKGTRVVVDDYKKDPKFENYIYFLFHAKTDPAKYQYEVAKLGNPNIYYYSNPSLLRPNRIGNITFEQVDWPTRRGDTGSVFVMPASDLPESEFMTDPKVKLLKEIRYPSGEIAFRIIKIL